MCTMEPFTAARACPYELIDLSVVVAARSLHHTAIGIHVGVPTVKYF